MANKLYRISVSGDIQDSEIATNNLYRLLWVIEHLKKYNDSAALKIAIYNLDVMDSFTTAFFENESAYEKNYLLNRYKKTRTK